MSFHLAVCCVASFSIGCAGIGVSVTQVNCGDHSDERPILYTWTKQCAGRSDQAELTAIKCAFICLSMNDVMQRLDEVLPRPGKLVSAHVLNDCQSTVQLLTTNRDYKRVQESFRSRYGCEVQVAWECNQRHSERSCLALVDGMAREAFHRLFTHQWVFTFAKPPVGGGLPSLPDTYLRPGGLRCFIPDPRAGRPAQAAILPSAAGTAASAASCPTEDRPTPFDLNTMD